MGGQVVDFYELSFMVISENSDKHGQDKGKVTTGSSFYMYIISSKQTVPCVSVYIVGANQLPICFGPVFSLSSTLSRLR